VDRSVSVFRLVSSSRWGKGDAVGTHLRDESAGSAEVDGGLGYAGYRDQLLPKDRITEAMDRLFREVYDYAHGDRLGLRIFRSGGRRALTRQRQRRVGRLRCDRQAGHHPDDSEDARARSEHGETQPVQPVAA
jgi:hypothetical protein